MTTEQKKDLYIKKMIELQKLWDNPIEQDWDFDFEDATDEQVDKMLKDVSGQLRFEKSTRFLGRLIRFVITAFIILGIIGLLVFGIRQLF